MTQPMDNKKKKIDNSLCRYCDPPVPHKDCPGHSISRNTTNRFMADKDFVAGSTFEVE